MSTNDFESFEYNIKQLTTPINLNIKKQDEVLDSEKFNTSLKSIEESLNTLYEKTRYLEDSIEYSKVFLDQKLKDFSNRINSTISSIEDIKNTNKNMSYIEYNVPFKENTVSTTDRDKNYKVQPCMIAGESKLLTLSERINQSYKCNSFTKSCEQIAYDDNFSELSNEKYRAVYIEDKPLSNGIIETITGYLPYACEINNLKITPVNATINNIAYVHPNGIVETLDKLPTGINTGSKIITHFKFNVTCKNYDIVEYVLDQELANYNNIWNDLKEFEYALSVAQDTKIKVDALISRTITHTGTNKSETIRYKVAAKETITVTKYVYTFGIDELAINLLDLEDDCYFLSEYINTGTFNEEEYIYLAVADNSGEYSNIEYCILDGDKEIPIMPIGQKYIYNERIFPEENIRFSIDTDLWSEGIIKIKKNGEAQDIQLEVAQSKYDDVYSISYQPVSNYYKYTPINSSIRVKAILRTYGTVYDTIPYIKNINIRKYGGNTLWTNLY